MLKIKIKVKENIVYIPGVYNNLRVRNTNKGAIYRIEQTDIKDEFLVYYITGSGRMETSFYLKRSIDTLISDDKWRPVGYSPTEYKSHII